MSKIFGRGGGLIPEPIPPKYGPGFISIHAARQRCDLSDIAVADVADAFAAVAAVVASLMTQKPC